MIILLILLLFNKLAKLGDAIALSKSETMNHSLTDPLTHTDPPDIEVSHGFHLRLVNVTPSLPPACSACKAQAANEENRLENPLSLGESFLALQKPERATKKTTPPTAIRRPVLHSDHSSATNGVNQQKYLLKHF